MVFLGFFKQHDCLHLTARIQPVMIVSDRGTWSLGFTPGFS